MNTEELKKLAMAATPGPWDDKCGVLRGTNGDIKPIATIYRAFNSAFIAASNPATILALIAERDELLAALKATESRLHDVATLCATAELQRDEAVRIALDAATSLETIYIRSYGDDSNLNHPNQMRTFAGSRAGVARTELKEMGIES